jgi:hypothetical protein
LSVRRAQLQGRLGFAGIEWWPSRDLFRFIMTLAGVLQDDVSVHGALLGAATAAGAGTDLGVLADVYGVMWLGDPDGLTACIERLLDAGMSIVCVWALVSVAQFGSRQRSVV